VDVMVVEQAGYSVRMLFSEERLDIECAKRNVGWRSRAEIDVARDREKFNMAVVLDGEGPGLRLMSPESMMTSVMTELK
jgi:hypothetical protein